MRSVIGATLVELLVVLVVFGLAVSLAGTAWQSHDFAEEVRVVARTISKSRSHAIVRGQPVSVTPGACAGGPIGGGLMLVTKSVISWPPRGLLYTSEGLPRTCDGGGVGNTTILLEHRGRQAAVIVSSLGRVRWELR